MLPLLGVKVVELSNTIAGFYGGLILADLGAEVIRVEQPESDPARDAGPLWRAAIFVAFNRNRKSVAIDLETTKGKEILKRLVTEADILLEDLELNVVNDLGFSYDNVVQYNPMIAYTSIKNTLKGPYETKTWTDGLIEAASGFMSTTGNPDPLQPLVREKPPVRLGAPVIHTTPGTFAAIWAMATLLNRKVTGKGEYIRVGRLESATTLIQQWVIDFSAHKFFEKHAARNYKTKDGQWVYFLIVNHNKYWRIFCDAFNVSEEDKKATEKMEDRFTGGTAGFTDRVNRILNDVCGNATKNEIWQKIIEIEIPGGAVNDIKTVVDEDPHVKATGFLIPMTADPEVTLTPEKKTFLTPMLPLASEDYNPEIVEKWSPPPKLGEHTIEVLTRLGYTKAQIASMRDSKIVKT
jgi:crotonobetainyl-CoA:carnitine CoA-transferase CaiB-like acyl-CoA transferase